MVLRELGSRFKFVGDTVGNIGVAGGGVGWQLGRDPPPNPPLIMFNFSHMKISALLRLVAPNKNFYTNV